MFNNRLVGVGYLSSPSEGVWSIAFVRLQPAEGGVEYRVEVLPSRQSDAESASQMAKGWAIDSGVRYLGELKAGDKVNNIATRWVC
jgi:hypothetical protein